MSARRLLAALPLLSSCSLEGPEAHPQFSSGRAVLLQFEFDGSLVSDNGMSPESQIQTQLRYTIGQLNGRNAVGRLDGVMLSDITTTPKENGLFLIGYHAVLPVGWSQKTNVPTQFTLKLPRNVSFDGLRSFVERYGHDCIDLWSASTVTTGNMWYYYRPDIASCRMNSEDFTASAANVSLSPQNRADAYPEMDRIWSDGELNAVVIFGKDVPGASSWGDFGISAYGRFNSLLPWSGFGIPLSHQPEQMPAAPGADIPQVTWTGSFQDGRRVTITALLVDNVRAADTRFDTTYRGLSRNADIIIYNGHAALGDNVRALARKGEPNPGQYTIVSMMGCDSFAYVDGYMAKQRSAINPDDPQGSKYLDMMTNITPANPTWLPQASLALLRGVLDPEKPQSYVQIISQFEPQHLAVVTGEEDNTFRPESAPLRP